MFGDVYIYYNFDATLEIEQVTVSRRTFVYCEPARVTLVLCGQRKCEFICKMKKTLFILVNQFYTLQSNPLSMKYTYTNLFSNPRNMPNSPFPVWPSASSSIQLLSRQSTRNARSGLWSFGNSQKSHVAKSGEYGGCVAICVEFLTKCSRRTSAV